MKVTYKKLLAFILSALLACAVFAGCAEDAGNVSDAESEAEVSEKEESSKPDEESEDVSDTEESTEIYEPEVNEHGAFRISSIDDVSDKNGTRSYLVYAPYTDTYTIEGNGVSDITVSSGETVIASGTYIKSLSLTENELYTLTVKTEPNADFKIDVKADNHLITLPYDVPSIQESIEYDVYGSDKLTAAEVNYIKRKGGTYIYSNNPEQFGSQHVGKAFMRNEGLKGDVYVTFEHANYSGSNAYLGYQLKNNTDHDVYITITNVGYQWIGTWFGQLAWYDFYNTSFELPDDYLNANGGITYKYSHLDYAYKKYQPRVYQPTTYRLPAGEYFWVIGGTSADAYRNINVDNSANHYVNNIRCANGNVKFTVTGGEVTGTMYCYTNASQVKAEPKALGYVAAGYAQQYSGIGNHHGVIDNYMEWTFGDADKAGMLPVTYTNLYANYVPTYSPAYNKYNSTPHVNNTTSWMTHLNPQNDHRAVGMDMVEFIWHDQNGKPIVIDNHHADGCGQPANTANWMIEYQDHFTLINQGDTERTVTLHLRDHGTLAILVRDSLTGEVLEASYTAGLGENSNVFSNYTYDVVIPAHSVKQITLDYLLVACSYGSVIHAAELK
ncbi:MAG: hypothetical protein IKT37_03545 [Clostridia bacterium]|nr:hypothetical protein [Clostridia bacterium]